VRPLPKTRVTELNEATAAFNAMVVAVRRFQNYVPRSLVRRLMNASADSGVAVEEREVTVMFTDMAGFTGLVERMTPGEMAGFLNDHFTLLTRAIEETGGVVDKYMGDGMLAYWGAPEHLTDHAARACAAAARITEAIRAVNETRLAADQPAIRVRIGINSGPAVVGDVGAPGRINYTIVGDTINVAARLEELGGGHYLAEVPTTVLVSESSRRAAGEAFDFEALGPHRLRGHAGDAVPVYRLRDAAEPRLGKVAGLFA
jgi:class 3 adenylate cyclase